MTNIEKNSMFIVRVDEDTGRWVGSAPIVATGKEPFGLAYSPDGRLLIVTNRGDDTVWMYEVDQETGAISPITGDLLKVVQREKILRETTPFTESIISIVEDYATDQKRINKKSDTEKLSKEDDAQAAEIEKQIAITAEQNKSANNDSERLFVAIKDSDAPGVEKYLTPFTVNKKRTSDGRTPLHEAVYLGKKEIAEQILNHDIASIR